MRFVCVWVYMNDVWMVVLVPFVRVCMCTFGVLHFNQSKPNHPNQPKQTRQPPDHHRDATVCRIAISISK